MCFPLLGKQKTLSEKIRFPVNFPLSITDYRDSNYFMQGGIKNHYEKCCYGGTYCSAQRPDKNTVLILYTNIQNRINNYSIHALTNTQRKLGKYLENMQIKLIPQNGFVLNSFYLHT